MSLQYKGQEYPAVVEFAPFQKVAKKRSKKRDSKSGTIEEGNNLATKKNLTEFHLWAMHNMMINFIDADYKKFLEIYNGDEEKFTSTTETLLEEIEAKTKELVGKFTCSAYIY